MDKNPNDQVIFSPLKTVIAADVEVVATPMLVKLLFAMLALEVLLVVELLLVLLSAYTHRIRENPGAPPAAMSTTMTGHALSIAVPRMTD
jgi:hypothetical protein